MSIDYNERREYARVDLKCKIKCKPEGEEKTDDMYTRSNNISVQGIRFNCDKALEIGAVINMELIFPYKAAPLDLKGQVRWCAPSGPETGESKGFVVGVKFLASDETLRKLLVNYVCGNWRGENHSVIS